jgi:hypothetical protein
MIRPVIRGRAKGTASIAEDTFLVGKLDWQEKEASLQPHRRREVSDASLASSNNEKEAIGVPFDAQGRPRKSYSASSLYTNSSKPTNGSGIILVQHLADFLFVRPLASLSLHVPK